MNGYKIHATLGCDRAHQHRLAAPWWPAQQHTFWHMDAEMRKPFMVHEWPLNALAQVCTVQMGRQWGARQQGPPQ
jgi:hypothetical protein